jgi:tetratricopeptide (TPR) repeat protein
MTAATLSTCHSDADGTGSFAAPPSSREPDCCRPDGIEAAAAGQQGVAAAGSASDDRASVDKIAALHARLGNACMLQNDLEGAAANYKAALRLAPHLTPCWCNLGNIHLRTGRAQDAVALYVQALTLNPAHWPSRTNLVHALLATRQYLVAKILLMDLVEERPQDVQIRNQLGKLHLDLNEFESALECFQCAVALNPQDAESVYWIGGIRQRMGETEAAEAAYAEAAKLQPLIRRPAARQPADFRVLALFAPFAGNTPTEYLFKDPDYDTDTLALLASSQYDAQSLQQDVQVVVNLISDADQADALLPLAADLVDRIGKPIINDPRKIQLTTRDAVAGLLQGIPNCRVPKVWRQKTGAVFSMATVRAALPAACPILVRPAGTHGGDDFAKIEGAAALAALLAQPTDTDRYLIEYIDYRSPDGYFRKYRFIFVDDQILPYHLAIGNDWKVHHDSTDMADHRWMQQEEEAFLCDPAAVFNAGHYQVLRAIKQCIDLEYFGIDCGLDRAGNLVVFEANASMLVHDDNAEFPYKTPFVHRIKREFDEMLRKFARLTLAVAPSISARSGQAPA